MERKKAIFIYFTLILAILLNGWAYIHVYQNFPDFAGNTDLRWSTVGLNLHKIGVYTNVGPLFLVGEKVSNANAPPVYPLMYYTIFSIVGTGRIAYEIMRIILLIMNIGIIYLSYRIGKLFNYMAGCVAALLAVFDLSLFVWANNYQAPDTVIGLFGAVAVYYLVKYLKVDGSYKNLTMSSLFLGICALTKLAVYLLWVPVAAFLLIFLLSGKKVNLLKVSYSVCLFVLIPGILIIGWKARNYIAAGTTEFSTQYSSALFWKAAHLKAYQEGISFREARTELSQQYQRDNTGKAIAVSEYKGNIYRNMIFNSPFDYAIVVLKRSRNLLLGSPWPNFLLSKAKREKILNDMKGLNVLNTAVMLKTHFEKGNYVYIFLWSFVKAHLIVIYLMSALGAFSLLKTKNDRWVLFGLFMIVGYVVAICSPESHARYRAPMMAVFYVLGGCGISYLWHLGFRKASSKIVVDE